MIPMVYQSKEYFPLSAGGLDYTNAAGHLLEECISCKVTEELNGKYELTLTYPSSSTQGVDDGAIIVVYANYRQKHDGTPDFFRAYRIVKPSEGVYTVYAEHISYSLTYQIVTPFTASTLASSITNIFSNQHGLQQITASADFTKTATMASNKVRNIKDAIMAKDGLVGIYGGYAEWFQYTFKLKATRAQNNAGFDFFAGTNIKSYSVEADFTNVYTQLFPYYFQNGNIVVGPTGEDFITIPSNYLTPTYEKVYMLDVTDQFPSLPSPAQVRDAGIAYVNTNSWGPKYTITADPLLDDPFVKVYIQDPIRLHTPYGDQTSEVTGYEWDALRERYTKLTIGTPKKTLGQVLVDIGGV